jgi:FG-GAP repeat
MKYLVMRAAVAGLMGAAALASQSLLAQETPVRAILPQDHEQTSAGFPITEYGKAVAIQGNVALVGAPAFLSEDANGDFLQTPLVEIYEGDSSGTTWTRTGSLLSPDPTHQSSFGAEIGLSGKCLVVGSDGTIQLFEKHQHTWKPSGVIGLTPVDQGGAASQNLAFKGDVLAFASFSGPTTSNPGTQTTPFVYVYRVTEGCKPHLLQRLSALSADTGAYGISVALGDDLLVVGSPGNFNNNSPPGQAYVYRREGNHWDLEQLLQSPTGAPDSLFGAGVAIAHHAILVGAANEDSDFDGEFTSAAGELYVFRKAHRVWAETQEIRPTPDNGVGAFADFGAIIAAAGDHVAVGAPSATDVFSSSFGPTVIYRWQGDQLVFDIGVANFVAQSLDVSRNRVIIGENTEGRGELFLNGALVLTYPKAGASTNAATDDTED